jgi:8-oxo-dGTP pyrophosphatase MutT (NUDIX family)
LKYRGKILLVQRSRQLNFYPGYWNGVSGFLDDFRSLKEKVSDELREEVGIPKTKIGRIRLGRIFDQEEPKYNKTWIVHPVLVEVKTGQVKLDWEAEGYRWVQLREAKRLKLLPGFRAVLEELSVWF